jgi:hypothetical protein
MQSEPSLSSPTREQLVVWRTHYGHLARDGREHAIKLLDALNAPWTLVDARWTSKQLASATTENESDA